jgi:hypothetical protein
MGCSTLDRKKVKACESSVCTSPPLAAGPTGLLRKPEAASDACSPDLPPHKPPPRCLARQMEAVVTWRPTPGVKNEDVVSLSVPGGKDAVRATTGLFT